MMECVRVEQPDAREPTRRTAVFLFLLASFTGSNASPIETNDELADAVNSVCHEQLYLEELVKLLKQGNDKRTMNLNQISAGAQKYKIAAGIADTMDKRCLYMALHHKFRRLHQEQKARVRQANNDVEAAMLAISEHIGVLKATTALAKTTLKLDTGNVHGNGGSSSSSIRIQLETESGTTELCDKVTKLSQISPQHPAIKPHKLKEIKLTDRKQLIKNLFKQHITLGTLTSCSSAAGYSSTFTTAINGCTGKGSKTLTGAQADSKPEYTDTSTALFKQHDPDKECQQPPLTEHAELDDNKNLQHHLCKALKAHSITVNTPTGLSGGALKDDEKLRVDVRNCMPALQGVKDNNNAEHNKAVVIEFIRSGYGTDANKFPESIQTPLSTMKASVRTASQTEKKGENRITTEEATAALSDVEGIRNTRKVETQKKREPTVTADQNK
uniref:Variant surface glycoprotein n=1 Tax=Trypanosoma brucei TaxID=5691 RepID=A0A1V0FZL4_9TRYP|nr:variant surface glycoprotein [Trypanosoma brucei]